MSQLVEQLFDFIISADHPELLIEYKACDSDKLDEAMAHRGIEVIAPHRSNRKSDNDNKTQDGRKLRRYKRRWKVERTIGLASELPKTLYQVGKVHCHV